jgi:tetratricopeptide (TPR) repeat protein
MYEIAIIVVAFLILHRKLVTLETTASAPSLAPSKSSGRLSQLVDYADRLYTEKKWLAAEKAYLSVLKVDHKNFTAYSHLGIIYSTQKNMPDAIECFEIAARLRPSGTSFQNLGLAYFDNKNYIKSVAAYEKAIMFEPATPRYVGLAKAWHKLANHNQEIAVLTKASETDASAKVLELLAMAYTSAGKKTEAEATMQRAQMAKVHLPQKPAAAKPE